MIVISKKKSKKIRYENIHFSLEFFLFREITHGT